MPKNKRQKVLVATLLIVVTFIALSTNNTFYLVAPAEETNRNSTAVQPLGFKPVNNFIVMSQIHRKPYIFEPRFITRNRTIPTATYRIVNKLDEYFVVTRALVDNSSRIIKYLTLPRRLVLPDIGVMEKVDNISTTTQSINYNDKNILTSLASPSIEVICDAPPYWERGTTIKTTVFIQNIGFAPYSFNGYISVIIQDEYIERRDEREHYIHNDVYTAIKTSFTLRRFQFEVFTIYVDIPPDTPVGLKSVVVTLGSQPGIGATFNMGYKFVQKYYHTELDNYKDDPYKNWLTYYEDELTPHEVVLNECETGDLGEGPLWHPTNLDVIKFAGKAGDVPYIDATVYEVGMHATSWVNQHFIYTKSLWYQGEEYRFDDYTYPDIEQIELCYNMNTGFFYGVCDEYATMLVSFMRALNIPARQIYLFGSPCHDIAELWIGNTWIHADPTENAYDTPSCYCNNGWYITDSFVVITVVDRDDDGLYDPGSFKYDVFWRNQSSFERLVAHYTGPNNYVCKN